MNRKNPNAVSEIDPESLEKVAPCSLDGLKNFIQVGPEKWCLLRGYEREAQKLYNFEVRPDDVWIVGMMRSGTTMTQDMVWLMLNDVDLETFKNSETTSRVPIFDAPIFLRDLPKSILDSDHQVVKRQKISIDILFGEGVSVGRGRVIKTHLPISLLPPEVLTSGCKVIYVGRNPKDAMVSNFLFSGNLGPQFEFIKTFDQYFDLFINDLVMYARYWKHIEQAWEKRHFPDFKFLFFENNTTHLRRTMEELAKFLGVVLTTDKLDQLEKVMAFDEFKKLRPAYMDQRTGERDLIRRGKVDGYREYMTREMIEMADRWSEENSRRIGIDFPLE